MKLIQFGEHIPVTGNHGVCAPCYATPENIAQFERETETSFAAALPDRRYYQLPEWQSDPQNHQGFWQIYDLPEAEGEAVMQRMATLEN